MSIRSGIQGGSPISPAWVAGRYYFCPNTNSLSTSGSLGNNVLRAVPFYVPNSVTLTKIGTEVTTIGEAGSKVRLGIYADDGTGRPGALVVDGGQINGDSATVQEVTLGTPVAVGPGWYWAAAAIQSAPATPPTLRVPSAMTAMTDVGTSIPSAGLGVNGWGATGISGAFPATLTVTAISSAARIFVKT